MLSRIEREAEVENNSQSYTSIHFSLVCHESFSEEWAEELLVLLEEAYDYIGEKLNFYPSQRSQVIVLQTEDFRRVHDLPEWAGGLYDGKIRLPVMGKGVKPDHLRGAISHEYTHHVIFLLSSGNCPVWLNEGLAQIFEFDSDLKDANEIQSADYKNLSKFVAIIKGSSRQKAAQLYKDAHNLTLKLVNDYGWSNIAEILEKTSRGFKFDEAIKLTSEQSMIEILETYELIF